MGDRMTKEGFFKTWKGEEPSDGKVENKGKNQKKLKEEKELQKGKKKDEREQSKGKGPKEDSGAFLQGGASSSRQIHDANLEQNNSEASSTRQTDDTDSGQNNTGDLSRRQANDADSTINPNRKGEFEIRAKLSNMNIERGHMFMIQKVLADAKDRELSEEERQTIRNITDQFKDGERQGLIQALRESYHKRTGVFGPLLPPQTFIKDLGYSVRKDLVVHLSDGDTWQFVAEKIGMTPPEMRVIDKRAGINPAEYVLRHWQYQANSTVGTLYSYLAPDFPVVADTF